MFVLLTAAPLLGTDERVHKKIAESRGFGEAMQKLFVEPSEPDETDRENAIFNPNYSRPHEGWSRMLGLPQPPTGFKALDPVDRLKRLESQVGDEITKGVKNLFAGASDEMQSVETKASFGLNHASSGEFDQLTGSSDHSTDFKSTDPLTNFDATSLDSDDIDQHVGAIGSTIGRMIGKEVAKQASKELAKNTVKQASRELIKQSVKEGIKEAAKESVKSPLKYLAREALMVIGGYFGIKGASELFNGAGADIDESESVTAGRVSGFTLNSEPQVIEALNMATGSSFNLNSGADQSESDLLVPGSAVLELNPKTDASQLLLA